MQMGITCITVFGDIGTVCRTDMTVRLKRPKSTTKLGKRTTLREVWFVVREWSLGGWRLILCGQFRLTTNARCQAVGCELPDNTGQIFLVGCGHTTGFIGHPQLGRLAFRDIVVWQETD